MFIKYKVLDHETATSTQNEIGEFAGIAFDSNKALISLKSGYHDICLPMDHAEYDSFLEEIYNALSSDTKIVTINNLVAEDDYDEDDEYYLQDLNDECCIVSGHKEGSYHLV